MFKIGDREIGKGKPTYFIADIASNHGGDLVAAKELVHACSESGVDAVKMQNFTADSIVSDFGFKTLSNVVTHQSDWVTSVYGSYEAAAIPLDWTVELKTLSEGLGMAYFTSPYSLQLVAAVEPYVSAFKVGSGDITWLEEIEAMARYDKPVLLATGASSIEEVELAVRAARAHTTKLMVMQCNTNYTARHGEEDASTRERFASLNLRVLETYRRKFPDSAVGLSDHTHGSISVLGAVGLFDCDAVEKHFTLDSSLPGQDHGFSMMPAEWKKMVSDTASMKAEIRDGMSEAERLSSISRFTDRMDLIQLAIGDGIKKIEDNEMQTVIVQRRAVRAARTIKRGEKISKEDLVVLRPCPMDAIPPYELSLLIGLRPIEEIMAGDYIKRSQLK